MADVPAADPVFTDPVFITGAHRAGTTILGEIVGRSPQTWTVWEPFNQHWGLGSIETVYPYINRATASPAVQELEKYLSTGRAKWRVKAEGALVRRAAARVRRARRRRREWALGRGRVPVVKDPFVLLSIGAVQPRLTRRRVVVAVRHPCSWVLSLRRMHWPAGPELNALIRQRELYQMHLTDLLPERDWTTANQLEAGARAWACLYRMVIVQADQAGIAVVPLEAFGAHPETVITFLFDVLDLESPARPDVIANEYARATGSVVPEGREKHQLRRDAQALSVAWKERLRADEIATVRQITAPVFDTFYEDWDSATGHVATLGSVPSASRFND